MKSVLMLKKPKLKSSTNKNQNYKQELHFTIQFESFSLFINTLNQKFLNELIRTCFLINEVIFKITKEYQE